MSTGRRRWWLPVAAVVALGYLILMVATGALPGHGQRIEQRAQGVLAPAPGAITHITITADERSLKLVRQDRGWTDAHGTGALDPALAARLERALELMHTAAPVRVLRPPQIPAAAVAAFGLDRPRLQVALATAEGTVLTAAFGGHNADGFLQYLRLKGGAEVYLLSRFLGQEWETIAAQTLR